MWGFSIATLEAVFFWATGIAAIAGGLAVAAAFIAGIVGYQVSDLAAKETEAKIAESNARAEEAKESAAKANAEAAKANARIAEMNRMRRLKKPQAEALKVLLETAPFQLKGGDLTLRVSSVADVEAQIYALDLQNFFQSCGVNVFPTDGGMPTTLMQSEASKHGLELMVKSFANPVREFIALEGVMLGVGMPVVVSEHAWLRDREAILAVLKKQA